MQCNFLEVKLDIHEQVLYTQARVRLANHFYLLRKQSNLVRNDP